VTFGDGLFHLVGHKLGTAKFGGEIGVLTEKPRPPVFTSIHWTARERGQVQVLDAQFLPRLDASQQQLLIDAM
jgi:hypothetical protein